MFQRSGPRDAVDEDFARFVAERSGALLRTAWLLTGDAARAEDLLLAALSAAWVKWAWILGGGGPPEEYVRRLLVTRYLSRRWRFGAPRSVLPEGGQAHDEGIRLALAGLTRQQRAAVVLRYVEGLSIVETADVLGCSAATVQIQAGRALAALRIDSEVNEDEIRQRLLGAVPTLSEPPDRLAVLRARVAARRRRQVGSAVVLAAAGVALVGALLNIPTVDGPLAEVAAHPSSLAVTPPAPSDALTVAPYPSGQVAVSSFVNPSVSQAYATISPGPDSTDSSDPPPRDAPLPLSGTCPTSVDLMRIPVHNPWDASTWPRRVTAVTLCRYQQSTFDTSAGQNILMLGPVTGDLAVFTAALDKALPPVRPIDHLGCRIVNSGPPYTVDIVFVTASGDSGKAYIMLRTLCDPPWLKDPERTLREAVDGVLGSPF